MLGGIQEEKYAVVDVTSVYLGRTPSILEEVEVSRAMFEVYEGGVVCTAPLEFCAGC
jgi:DEAD/DEAH box helicase domain-containing protein